MATVYNNLNVLCAQGQIRRLSVEGQPDRYDRNVRHDHLFCRCCGKLRDVFLEDLTDRLRSETGLEIESYDLKLSYVCKGPWLRIVSITRSERTPRSSSTSARVTG